MHCKVSVITPKGLGKGGRGLFFWLACTVNTRRNFSSEGGRVTAGMPRRRIVEAREREGLSLEDLPALLDDPSCQIQAKTRYLGSLEINRPRYWIGGRQTGRQGNRMERDGTRK